MEIVKLLPLLSPRIIHQFLAGMLRRARAALVRGGQFRFLSRMLCPCDEDLSEYRRQPGGGIPGGVNLRDGRAQFASDLLEDRHSIHRHGFLRTAKPDLLHETPENRIEDRLCGFVRVLCYVHVMHRTRNHHIRIPRSLRHNLFLGPQTIKE